MKLFDRIPFYFKIIALVVAMVASLTFVMMGLYDAVSAMVASLNVEPLFKERLTQYFLKYASVGGFLLMAIWVFFYRDLQKHLQYLNHQFARSVVKKRMTVNFDRFKNQDIFGEIGQNASAFFALFKEYDGMKSSRISLEVNTTKQLMNTMHEGAILVNPERLITHINHPAESLLRFVPGEVLGQAVSRFISQNEVLQAIEECLDKGIKETILLGMSDDENYEFRLFPIKNKQKDPQRALIVVRLVPKVAPKVDPEKHSS